MAVPASMFNRGLERTDANYVPLSPLSFLRKSAEIYPTRTAIVYGDRRQDWAATYTRCRRLASALRKHGVRAGDAVAILAPNTPPMVEAHFGIPMAGAVINTLNMRLDPGAIAFQLQHGEARILLADRGFKATVDAALRLLGEDPPLVVDIADPEAPAAAIGELEYESFLAEGDADFAWALPADEWDAISLNYTSGTTGNPKGVVAHHRGAYLNALNNAFLANMNRHPVYLWVVPMFHCNGWCHAWTVAALAGTNVCLRRVDAAAIFDAIRRETITHMSGAPIIYTSLIDAAPSLRDGIAHRVAGVTGGAPPPSRTFLRAAEIGIDLIHIYGLTETYGPAATCPPQDDWADLAPEDRVAKISRQGCATLAQEDMRVLDPTTLAEITHDGVAVGEIMFRGNIVMKGYLKNEAATKEAFAGGWFHTGDLAAVEPDGYVRITDRSKDVIISGGENISSVEVEEVLCRHPAVRAAAVIGRPDTKWGEVPAAFVELRPGATADELDLASFCRCHLAGFKMPKTFVFGELPRTSTGKVQKFVLRKNIR